MLQVGDPLTIGGQALGSFVAPPSATWSDTSARGHGEGVHLDVHPLLARRLLAVPLVELDARARDVADLDQPWLVRLTEEVGATSDWSQRLDLVEAALLARLAATSQPAGGRRLAQAFRMLDAGVGVQATCEAVGGSRRHLHRTMTTELGLTPSQVRRLGRFRRTRRILTTTTTDLAQVAAVTGWADQSHLHREVRALAGCTPAQLRAHVPSVQDSGVTSVPA
jgi:AraC-like DNA-binding protein